MTDVTAELIVPWADWGVRLREGLEREKTLAGRAREVARLLQEMAPQARFLGCHFGEEGCAFGEAVRLPEEEGAPGLKRFNLGERGVALRASFTAPLLGGVGRWSLVLGLPPDVEPGAVAALGASLSLAARLLELELQLEEARAEKAESAEVTTAGEAVLGVLHTLNNHLNSMVLQAAALQMRLPEPLKGELQNVRREGKEAAERLRPLQAVRDFPLVQIKTDLNKLLDAVLRESPELAGRLEVRLGRDVPPLDLPAHSLKRLLRLLCRVAVAGQVGSRPVPVSTKAEGAGAQVMLELEGVELESDAKGRLFDLPLSFSSGTGELERMAAHSLVRRLGGALAVSKRPGGVVVTVTWQR